MNEPMRSLYWRVPKYESILFRAAARCVVGDRPLSASLPMPTFGAMSRRENGKLLERSILGLGSLRRTTCPIEYGNAWKSSLLSLYGRAFADVKESTVLLEPTQRPCRIAGIIVRPIGERVIIVVGVYWHDC